MVRVPHPEESGPWAGSGDPRADQALWQSVAEELGKIRSRLLDLSKRNRLLNYRRSKLTIKAVEGDPRIVFEQLVTRDKSVKFVPAEEENAPHMANILQTQR